MASDEPKAIFDYRIVYENGKKAILKKIEEKEWKLDQRKRWLPQ